MPHPINRRGRGRRRGIGRPESNANNIDTYCNAMPHGDSIRNYVDQAVSSTSSMQESVEPIITSISWLGGTAGGAAVPLAARGNSDVLKAIIWANEKVEFGENGILNIRIKKGDKSYKIKIEFNRMLELSEIFIPENFHSDLKDFMNEIYQKCEEGEPPHQEGTSYIHLTVGDKANEKVLGRITACIKPDHGDLMISFAYCRSDNNFSRKRGRIISNGRLNDGHYIKVTSCQSRFETVMGYFIDIMELGQCDSVNLSSGELSSQFPPWILSEDKIHEEDLLALLKDVVSGKDVSSHVSVAEKYLGITGVDTKYIMHRDRP